MGVAEVVKPDRRNARCLDEAGERLPDRVRADRVADLVREDTVARVGRHAEPEEQLPLARPVALQEQRRGRVEVDRRSELVFSSAPGRDRTCDARFRKPTLYPLSYGSWPGQTSDDVGHRTGDLVARTDHLASPGVMVRRLCLLYVGLAIYGLSLALVVQGDLGLAPWDVFHQGVARQLDARLGLVLIATSFAVLLLWIPLRVRPGVGTISNAVLVGIALDIGLRVVPEPSAWAARIALLAAGVLLNGVATGMYIGAGLGPGPRDGLMTGIARRGHPLRTVRTAIEIAVLAAGFALGGTVGVGTVAYAVAIGPLAHVFLPIFSRLVDAGDATEPEAPLPGRARS
jgi:uncharacterized membrane protein YczE